MKRFTSKAYLVTFERRCGFNRVYGVSCICNKKSEANLKLAELNKTCDPKIEYKIVEADLNKGGELFQFNY